MSNEYIKRVHVCTVKWWIKTKWLQFNSWWETKALFRAEDRKQQLCSTVSSKEGKERRVKEIPRIINLWMNLIQCKNIQIKSIYLVLYSCFVLLLRSGVFGGYTIISRTPPSTYPWRCFLFKTVCLGSLSWTTEKIWDGSDVSLIVWWIRIQKVLKLYRTRKQRQKQLP